ncbi:hypothetical protein LX64_04388 [Chitinophaga skermanii]|uniref:DUF1440 domain-containing protein n=1 Tax=Chitinophaga skermanii TaxID=331697 RepID=A0A327Q5M8_9BACT|nr:hypothetical protein [Chitinophaga skermanii]RAI99835.1 hypothetical protein LX64_04388 [Chitinophaga skermanii]
MHPVKKSIFSHIMTAGLIVGTLDGLAACIQFIIRSGGFAVEKIFLFIAGGVLGKTAFQGGMGVVLLGIVLHYCIAMGFTAMYFLLYPRVLRVVKNRFWAAVLFGVSTWLVMNLIVLPLSLLPRIVPSVEQVLIGMGILIVAVGWPIVVLAERYYKR